MAYLVITETLAGSPPGAENTLSINASLRGDTLVMNLDGTQALPSQYLCDQIGASDGVLTHRTGVLHVEIPCG